MPFRSAIIRIFPQTHTLDIFSGNFPTLNCHSLDPSLEISLDSSFGRPTAPHALTEPSAFSIHHHVSTAPQLSDNLRFRLHAKSEKLPRRAGKRHGRRGSPARRAAAASCRGWRLWWKAEQRPRVPAGGRPTRTASGLGAGRSPSSTRRWSRRQPQPQPQPRTPTRTPTRCTRGRPEAEEVQPWLKRASRRGSPIRSRRRWWFGWSGKRGRQGRSGRRGHRQASTGAREGAGECGGCRAGGACA